MEVALKGILPVRSLGQCVSHTSLAPLLARSALARDSTGDCLAQIAGREGASDALKDLNDVFAKLAEGMDATNESHALAFSRPLIELFVSPRSIGAQASVQKVGRNDPCPCGSGKKYKKCHAGQSGPRAAPDASGTPGLTKAEVFPFREVTGTLSELCHARVVSGGPRPGDTLYWPIEAALPDEMVLRAELAGTDRAQLNAVLARAWELEVFSAQQVAAIIEERLGVEAWWDPSFRAFLGALPAACRSSLSFTGGGTIDELITRSHRPGSVGLVAAGVETSAQGDLAQAADQVLASLLAGALAPALALARFLLVSHPAADPGPLGLVGRIELPLALALGHAPMPMPDRKTDGAAQVEVLARTNKVLTERVQKLEQEVEAERELRTRAEEAWASCSGAADDQEALRHELRRLKNELKAERESARAAIKDVQQFRRRERIRLLRESELEADVVAALVGEMAPEEDTEEEEARKEISYLPEFEEAAARLAPSTIERLKGQVQAFARGQWIREAKRMEATDGVWTLRAGLHYRALMKVGDETIQVFALIPREELDSALARLRRN